MAAISTIQIEQLLEQLENKSLSFATNLNHVVRILQDKESENVAVKCINNKLRMLGTRDVGFTCVNLLILHGSNGVVLENWPIWIKVATSCNKIEASQAILLGNLIRRCSSVQDFNKILMTNYLRKIIDLCVSSCTNENQVENILTCLDICLQKYPSTCGPMKDKIEKFLFQFLDLEANDVAVKCAGRCFHFLQQVGNGGVNGINHSNNWSTSIESFCALMHKLYNSFFENVTEYEQFNVPDIIPYSFPQLPANIDTVGVLSCTEKRLNNICTVLQTMFMTGCSFPKHVRPQVLLDVIRRCLSLHSCFNMNSYSTAKTHFGLLLLKHQVDVLRMLRSIIAMLQLNLLPFCGAITKILVDCLNRTQHCACFDADSMYKETVYKVLTFWIKTIKNNLPLAFQEKLFVLIKNDIKPMDVKVSLCLKNITKQNDVSAKKKKSETLEPGSIEHVFFGKSKNGIDIKEKTCCQALECLSYMYSHIHISVERDILQHLLATLISTVIGVQNGKMVHPYKNVSSHISLYQTLLSVAVNYTPIIPLAINVFTRGQQSNNQHISQISTRALTQIEMLCQPVGQSLNLFHLQNVEDKSKEIADYSKTLPEQNSQIFADMNFSCDGTGLITEELEHNESEINESNKQRDDEIVTLVDTTSDVTNENVGQEDSDNMHENSVEENSNNFSFDESSKKDDLFKEKCFNVIKENKCMENDDITLKENEECKEDVQTEQENKNNSIQAEQDHSNEGLHIVEENVITKEEVVTKCDVAANDDEPARKKMKVSLNGDDPGDINEMLNSFIDIINE